MDQAEARSATPSPPFAARLLQAALRLIFTLLRPKITGAEHLSTPGPVIFAANHQSLLDGPMLLSILGPDTAFVMTNLWAERPFMRRIGKLVPILATDPSKPMSIKTLARRIRDGQSCVIFPEGRITGDALAHTLGPDLAGQKTLGLLLPTATAVPAMLLALWRLGVTPAMLNPTLGPGPMKTCLATAQARTVLTSTAMIDQLKLHPVIADLEAAGIRVIRAKDLRARITTGTKLRAYASARFGAARQGRAFHAQPARATPAVILFTSGTEGAPKGVVLTHGNLLANIAQLRARTDINAGDHIFTALTVLHSFGLTCGLLLPLVAGAEVVCQPSPLHYRIIPETASYHQPTIIFGTDSFLSGWGRRAHDYDFASLRAAIAGAEPIKQATRDLWSRRFGVRILEGYGATETAPVRSLNTPISSRDGSVGRLLPAIEAHLDPIEGVDATRLSVRGPNIMAGYIRASARHFGIPHFGDGNGRAAEYAAHLRRSPASRPYVCAGRQT